MITVEVKDKAKNNDNPNGYIEKYVIVNGIPDFETFYVDYGHIHVGLQNVEIVNILLNHTFLEVGQHFSSVEYWINKDWWMEGLGITLICNKQDNDIVPSIKITIGLDAENWSKPWSMLELSKAFANVITIYNKSAIQYFQDDESITEGFGVVFSNLDLNSITGVTVSDCLTILSELLRQTVNTLVSNIDLYSIITFFQFPDSVKTSCVQYLVYFTQFIADLGIEVETEIKEEYNHTLFKIVPKNKDEALTIIKEALSVYLQVPSMTDFEIQSAGFKDISITQWQANIYHLKSQIAVSKTLLQAKDAVIENLQLSNYQYKQILGERENINNKDKDEVLIEDIVSVKKMKGKDFL